MNTYDAIALTYEKGKAMFALLQQTIAWNLLAADTGRNTLIAARQALLSGELIKLIGIAAAYAIANPFTALIGLGVAAAAGALIYSQMKDGVIDPKKGPVMSGEFGSVQLDPNDKAMYGADGKIKVGTDLAGEQRIKAGATIPQTRPSAMANAARQTDSSSEIKQMRSEMSGLLKTLVNKTGDIYMDSNRVGKSLALGSYKSS